MHFGQFLIATGRATPAQILAALDEQRRGIPLLGRIAVREKWLSVEQVLHVLDAQHKSGRPFGSEAVELGLLAPATAERLMRLQRESMPPLGEILVAHGVFSAEDLAGYLREFLFREQHLAPFAQRT